MATESMWFYLVQTVISFFFFEYVSRNASWKVLQSLPATSVFSKERKADFRSRVVSNVHAFIVTAASLYALVVDVESRDDLIWGDSFLIRSTLAISVGYFISDLIFILSDVENNGGWGYVCHHISAIWPYSVVLVLGCLQYFANFRLIAEISTPFVNARWYYDITGQKDSKKYFYNGIVLAFAFFISRIATIPYYYYMVYTVTVAPEFSTMALWIQVSWLLPCIVLDILNVFWFWKIVRGAFKILGKQKKSTESSTADNMHLSTCEDCGASVIDQLNGSLQHNTPQIGIHPKRD